MTNELSDKVTVVFASQTGNAESIARNICDEAIARNFSSKCMVADDLDKAALEAENVLIFVVSTTGDGDPPDNCIKFWRQLRKMKSDNILPHVQYAILGLGDTNYDNFCNTAKRLDRKFQEVGATPFYPRGLADDATGLEEIVDPWIEGLWDALAKVCSRGGQTDRVDEIANTMDSIKVESHGLTAAETEELQSGHKIMINEGALANLSQLTGLPRIPNSVCKIADSAKAEAVKTEHGIPGYIKVPGSVFTGKIKGARMLTSPDAIKRTIHLSVDISECSNELEYAAGDAFGIVCPNNELLVNGILQRLGVSEEESNQIVDIEPLTESTTLPTHLQGIQGATIADIFRYVTDLTSLPKKGFLRMLAEHTSDETEKKLLLLLSSKQGASDFNSLKEQMPTLLDILSTFPSCKPPLARLIENLPPHQPRYYSVSNSPLKHPKLLNFAFNIVKYSSPEPFNVPKVGVCTPWLDDLSGLVQTKEDNEIQPSMRASIPLFLKKSQTPFVLPSNTNTPIIMVGPGTGVAPFVGFCQHRDEQRKIKARMGTLGRNPSLDIENCFGEMWLFYGCRHKERDYLYRKELEDLKTRGVLKELVVCFSREAEDGEPKYVQDNLRKYGEEIYKLMAEKNAYFYLCGDAKNMAKGVNEALTDILCEYGGLAKMEAIGKLGEWTAEGRIFRDLWA
ncbi:riboflavin synthase domain-like protein [Basidiobolus meristosporus CBS 931.73]|uniref:Methionine synthase reductase n=1 Tax=Basidiobolus meristosporus CBS 931.73 TaxID=1314790 RepID=A0A1Y1XWG0_9FUNG|nr:riboflavin synthase domain-like protein [Basidiobolus meristosporus CBS 931.73]|eukprot:ORX90107.1 riboflavin synthase domain-like protein [Basidiobolus meristosporus CBS 931.73]